ncbi:MAG: tyrosine-protein phosphatase [Ruminococcaceae bacterium]|nr:tyrosine-protein phosphatase [Oscillospiraceae bacterium]MBR3597164.1 tyrosine-protein phosphatase [Clostridia bacterium]
MEIKRIKLKSLKNTRDIGGFRTVDGKSVKQGVLIRSGHLARASATDISRLVKDYNLRTVIDLRTEAEIKEKTEMLPDIIEYKTVPLLDNSFLGIARDEYSIKAWFNMFLNTDKDPDEVFCEMYEMLVFGERSKKLIPLVFEEFLSDKTSSILWHCSAGKDRVGVITMLLLLALGVERETIIEDYLATKKFSAKEIFFTKFFSPLVIKEHKLRKCISVLMGVKRQYIERLFERIDNEFDGIEDFFEKQYGISDGDLMKLKAKYLV